MHGRFPGKPKLLYLAILMAGVSVPAFAQQGDNTTVEEVVVTGSYIRGTPLDAPSPVQVIDRNGIEAQGAAVIWDVIKNLEVNSGSVTGMVDNPGSASTDHTIGTANVNLRNLGENSTLTLINGKRQVSAATTTRSGGEYVDLNTIPLVMTERVEILTDGGSALYGSDAVAGVANIIMRTEFEGLEVYGDIQGMQEASGLYDETVSAIWGWASDDGQTHFVLSGEYFERDPVGIENANFYDSNSQFVGTVGTSIVPVNIGAFGSNVNPAFINRGVIDKNLAEGGRGTLVYTDPGCGTVTSADGTPTFVGTLRATRGQNTGTCLESTTDWTLINVGQKRSSFAGALNHSFSEKLEFYSFFNYSDSDIKRSDDGYSSTRGPTIYFAPPGAHTPNPAFGGYAIGQPAELGYYAPKVGLTRPTAADIPNSPFALANGGVNVPGYGSMGDGWIRQDGDVNTTWSETIAVQTGLKGEFYVNDKRYNYDVGYSWSGSSMEERYTTYGREQVELAANGLGGPNCKPNGTKNFDFNSEPAPNGLGAFGVPTIWDIFGPAFLQDLFPGYPVTTRESLSLALTSNNQGKGGCMFYNPFLTALTNPSLANSPELMDWMKFDINRSDRRNKLGVFDAVLSGELFEMPGGTAQFAVGAQRREQTNNSRASALDDPGLPAIISGYDDNGVPNSFRYASANYDCAYCIFNYDVERNVNAAFLELSLPFLENVESQLALRYEDYGGAIGSELTPKIALSWRPLDSLLLRGSFSQSFRAPNVGIQQEGLEFDNVTFRDPIRNQKVRAGLLPATNENALPNNTYTRGSPAPGLGNEYADTYSAGFMWTPGGMLDGFRAQADFWRFDLTDKVLPQPPISGIADEIALLVAASKDPANYVLNASTGLDAAIPYKSCDPGALEAQFGRDSAQRLECVVDPRLYYVEGVVRTVGITTGALTTVVLSAINAGTIETDGVDVKLGYNWANDWGRFNLGLDYTYVHKYKLSNVPGLELGLLETGNFDAAGTTGDDSVVRSLPDNKGHITFNWLRDSHSVTVINRHVGSYQDLAYDNTYIQGNDLVRSLAVKKIDSYQSWDLQYSYAHQWANSAFGTSIFTLGVLDAFNADLPYREAGSLNYDASVFDGRGRRLYARALLQF